MITYSTSLVVSMFAIQNARYSDPACASTNTGDSRIKNKTGESNKDKSSNENVEESATTGKGNGTNNGSFVDKNLAGKIGSENDVTGDNEKMQTTTRGKFQIFYNCVLEAVHKLCNTKKGGRGHK